VEDSIRRSVNVHVECGQFAIEKPEDAFAVKGDTKLPAPFLVMSPRKHGTLAFRATIVVAWFIEAFVKVDSAGAITVPGREVAVPRIGTEHEIAVLGFDQPQLSQLLSGLPQALGWRDNSAPFA